MRTVIGKPTTPGRLRESMKFPNQMRVLERLEDDTVKNLDLMRKKCLSTLYHQWGATRRDLRRTVWQIYKDVVPNGVWDYGTASRTGSLKLIDAETKKILDRFKSNSATYVHAALSDLYKESVLRQAWMLDQLTPPSYKVRIPRKPRIMEAGRVRVASGEDALLKWRSRWEGWLDAYHGALNHNINLGAINDQSVDDTVDEVDKTKASTPAYDIWTALQRVFMDISQVSIAMGQSDVAEENQESLGTKTIWQTRYNQRVCDVCDANAGLTQEDADGDIPAHPNCFCYWRVVPQEWADMLASGDENERQAAIRLDATGDIPASMMLLDDNGKPKGHLIVNFDDWADETGAAA